MRAGKTSEFRDIRSRHQKDKCNRALLALLKRYVFNSGQQKYVKSVSRKYYPRASVKCHTMTLHTYKRQGTSLLSLKFFNLMVVEILTGQGWKLPSESTTLPNNR